MENTDYPRMLEKNHKPLESEILAFIGGKAGTAWAALQEYLTLSYHIAPEIVFFAKNYGWSLRYLKSGRTLCYLFPEKGAFTVLIVLGPKEIDKSLLILEGISSRVKEIIENTHQYPEGKWLYIRIFSPIELDDIKKLLSIKKKPKN